MKVIRIMVVALAAAAASGSVALADGYKDCTKLDKA
ncbi:MAG: PepSY domain-containing protein, partial [Bradyrhizobium sp.]|nr:PepSY domain-containing protein [Bradyrhizobium sp.]